MTVSELIRTKRAVRQFRKEPISEEAVRSILNAGRRAQSSKNTQPWHFIAIRDRETLRQLSQCGMYAGHLAGAPFAIALIASTAEGFDLGQATAYMQLAAWELGIGSCIASMWKPKKAKAILGFRRTCTLMSRSPLAILSTATSILPLQIQAGASRSTRWCSGNAGMEERVVLARLKSHTCTRIIVLSASRSLVSPSPSSSYIHTSNTV